MIIAGWTVLGCSNQSVVERAAPAVDVRDAVPASLEPGSLVPGSLEPQPGRADTVVPTECDSTTLLDVDGHQVVVAMPDAVDQPVPLLVALHGFKGTPLGLAQFSELSTLAERRAAVVAYPAGEPQDLGFGWNSGAARHDHIVGDGAGLIADVVAQLVDMPCVDRSRVWLAGESNGGAMAASAACDDRLAGMIRGVALVNPAIDAGVVARCDGRRLALATVVATGSRDTVVPPTGGRGYPPTNEWLGPLGAALSGCESLAPRTTLDAHVSVTVGRGCDGCLAAYRSDDGGHTWPGVAEGANDHPVGSFDLNALLAVALTESAATCQLTPR